MNRLDGKVAIVTGGARGQGEAEVRLFVAEGARVVFGDVLDDLGEIVAKDLGDAAVYLHHDVRREEDWTRVVGEAESRFGKVDVLVNNAGVLDFGTLTHETSLDDYMRLVEINQVGPFLGMKTVIPGDAAQPGWFHRQHLVDQRVRGLRRHDRVYGVQVRGTRHDQDRRARIRQGGDPDQLDPPRRHRHADDARCGSRRDDRRGAGRDVRDVRDGRARGSPTRSRASRSTLRPTSRATAPAPSSSSTAG